MLYVFYGVFGYLPTQFGEVWRAHSEFGIDDTCNNVGSPSDCNTAFSFWLGAEADTDAA